MDERQASPYSWRKLAAMKVDGMAQRIASKKILAVASGGGHWIQLYRMRPAWDGHRVTYATTMAGLDGALAEDARHRRLAAPAYVVLPDANRREKLKLVWLLLRVGLLMVKLRPDFIVSTGAAPGYFALRLGKFMGAQTVWIDSIANAEEMSLSGRLARRHADRWLTQWEHLAAPESGPEYHGSVL